MKEFLKALNNFRLSSLLMAIGGLVGLVAVVLAMSLFQTSGTIINADNVEQVVVAFYNNQVAGMVMFVLALVAVIIGIVVIYKAVPFIFPKKKQLPMKSMGWILLAENVFVLGVMILVFVLLATEKTNHPVGYVISVVLSALSIVYSCLWIYPTIKCDFYCPELSAKQLAK